MSDLRVAHDVLAQVFQDDPEPIPSWELGDLFKLETCRASIEVEAFGVRKYPDLESCAAKLFYATVKAHAFPNGNKRFGLVLVLLFLMKNEMRLTVPAGVAAQTAKQVAQSDPHTADGHPDAVVMRLTAFFRDSLEPRSAESG